MTLISTILDSINAVNWTNPNHDGDVLYCGAKIGKYTVSDFAAEITYHANLGNPNEFSKAAAIRKIADMGGLTSSGIDTATKIILDNMGMFSNTHIPIMYRDLSNNEWAHAYRWGNTNLYRVAKALNYQLAKWNSTLAWQEMKASITAIFHNGSLGQCPLGIDPTNNTYDYANNRFYDENVEWLEWFVSLYEIDRDNNKGSMTFARDIIWQYINNNHWAGDHYWYSPLAHDYECEGAFFHMVFARLMAVNGYGLPNWDRVLLDMKNRFLTSLWSSPQWSWSGTPIYCVVHHSTSNSQHRLENTVGAFFSLQAFYQLLDVTSKANWVTMLDGSTKAWEHLINESLLYDPTTKKFRWWNGLDLEDAPTAAGILLLFLQGIVPQTGALYSPIHEWYYECYMSMDDYFKFDYTTYKLRLPIMHGSIKFIYGTTPVTYTFANDGVYDIQFASDWNTITGATKVLDLDPLKTYVRQIGAPIVQKSTTLGLTLQKG